MEQNTKKEDLKKQRAERSKAASTNVSATNKALVLAGVANVWLVLNCDKISSCDTKCLLITLVLFAVSIFEEYIQYTLEALVHKHFAEKMPMEQAEDGTMTYKTIPKYLSTFAWISWGIKVVCTLAAYIILGIVLFRTFWPC